MSAKNGKVLLLKCRLLFAAIIKHWIEKTKIKKKEAGSFQPSLNPDGRMGFGSYFRLRDKLLFLDSVDLAAHRRRVRGRRLLRGGVHAPRVISFWMRNDLFWSSMLPDRTSFTATRIDRFINKNIFVRLAKQSSLSGKWILPLLVIIFG